MTTTTVVAESLKSVSKRMLISACRVDNLISAVVPLA
jgi:hypothetical protein